MTKNKILNIYKAKHIFLNIYKDQNLEQEQLTTKKKGKKKRNQNKIKN